MSLNIFAKPDGVKARLVAPRRKQVTMRILARLDRGTAQSARSRLMDVISVDRTTAAVSTPAATAEIATLRQKLAAAEPRVRENTDRGRKPIKGGAGRRMVDGKNFRLADQVRYILRRAAEHDGRVVTIGQLVLFSTETGDAWLLDPSDQLAARLARDGDPEPFHIEENETTFTVVWKGRYRIEGTAFVYMDRETGTIHGSDGAKEDVKIEASPELAATLNPKRE